MKKMTQIISGMLALVFGLNFIAYAAKTDFQKKLEACVSVSDEESAVDSECTDKCTQNKIR